MAVTIYHNPMCSKSRATLQLLQERNTDLEIIEYLKNPPNVDQLSEILDLLKMEPRDLMRKNEAEYKANSLDNAALQRPELLQGMVDNPKLIERPIVLANGKASIGRPPESVLEIL